MNKFYVLVGSNINPHENVNKGLDLIKKNNEFTCNLALIENNTSTLGFVTVPVKELIYYGGKQFGSKLIN